MNLLDIYFIASKIFLKISFVNGLKKDQTKNYIDSLGKSFTLKAKG